MKNMNKTIVGFVAVSLLLFVKLFLFAGCEVDNPDIVDALEDDVTTETSISHDLVESVAGIYIEIETYHSEELVFSPMQFEQRAIFALWPDSIFGIGSAGDEMLPYTGTFEVEKVTFEDIDISDKATMFLPNNLSDVALYRISAANTDGAFMLGTPHIVLYLSFLPNGDKTIYWPAYFASVKVRKIIGIEDVLEQDLHAVVGHYTERRIYCASAEEFVLVDPLERVIYTFNSDMTYRIVRDERVETVAHGVFGAERFDLEALEEKYRALMPGIDDRADYPLYRIVIYDSADPCQISWGELFISRGSDEDIIIFWPFQKRAGEVRLL